MTTRKVFHCIVDDTALITNISELESWVSQGIVTLVVPLYTLERLHLLKKDASQIGMNARKAVKFLDRVTSDRENSLIDPVIIQQPDEQYTSWTEVEKHFIEEITKTDKEAVQTENKPTESTVSANDTPLPKMEENAAGSLSQMLLSKLNFAKEPAPASPNSTPPTSPSPSSPQSSKTTPEIKLATMTLHDASPTPPALKPLLNTVVWYTFGRKSTSENSTPLFLTNAADTANLARGFGIAPRNIHQLRETLNLEDKEAINQDRYFQKHSRPASAASVEAEPKAMFKYDEDESDDEVVVFKPRGRGTRTVTTVRGSPAASLRGRSGLPRSPVPNFAAPVVSSPNRPQVPTDEIDPDSFDRGGFARGSIPLANTGNHVQPALNGTRQGPHRGNFVSPGQPRGSFYRGAPRGFDRGGAARGRGRLFVP